MALDVTKINTIEEAKKAKYGGKLLEDSEKSEIFGDVSKFNTNGSLDVKDKLQKVCELLDQVKEAATMTTKTTESGNLLTKLEGVSSSSEVYKIVNIGTKKRVEESIAKLKNLKKNDDKRKKELEEELARVRGELKLIEKEIEKEQGGDSQEVLNKVSAEVSEKKRIWEEFKSSLEGKNLLAKGIADHNDIKRISNNLTGRMEKFYEFRNDGGFRIYETRINESACKYFSALSVTNGFATNYVKILKEVDVEKTFEAIERNIGIGDFFSHLASDEERDKLKNILKSIQNYRFFIGGAERNSEKELND